MHLTQAQRYETAALLKTVQIPRTIRRPRNRVVLQQVQILLTTYRKLHLSGPDRTGCLDIIRLRHYTSNKGRQGIKESMVIKTGNQNAVFATRAKGKPLGKTDAAAKFKIKETHARNYIDFNIDDSRVEYRK